MTPNDYIIKRFETNYPELVDLIEIWAEHSIKQNWDDLSVLLNRHTVSNCPADEYCDKLKGNKQYLFLNELANKMAEYLLATGYKMVSTAHDKLVTPDGKTMYGYVVRASTQKRR